VTGWLQGVTRAQTGASSRILLVFFTVWWYAGATTDSTWTQPTSRNSQHAEQPGCHRGSEMSSVQLGRSRCVAIAGGVKQRLSGGECEEAPASSR
jgi:hypothetical protein